LQGLACVGRLRPGGFITFARAKMLLDKVFPPIESGCARESALVTLAWAVVAALVMAIVVGIPLER
jgi:hypothetical protein